MSASSACYACVKKTTLCPVHEQADITRDQLSKLLDLIPEHLLPQAQKILDDDDEEESEAESEAE